MHKVRNCLVEHSELLGIGNYYLNRIVVGKLIVVESEIPKTKKLSKIKI